MQSQLEESSLLHLFPTHKRIFYGWVIVAAIVASSSIVMGANSSFGVFFKSLEEAYGLTRASTSAILSVRMVFNAVAAFVAGWAIDRYGPRKIVSTMGFFIGLSLVLTGLTTESWQIFITYGLLMSAGSGAIFVVVTSTVLHWFNRKRGLALGIAGAGGGIGTAAISPLSAFLIGSLQWRKSIILLGGFSCLVVLPAAQLLKKDPYEMGTMPDGEFPDDHEAGGETTETAQHRLSLRQLFLMKNFWAIFFIWFVMAFSSFFIMTHIVPHALDIGFSPVESASILSVIGVAMIGGRLGSGILSDRVSTKGIAIVSSLVQFAAILSLVWARELWMLYLFGIVHGLTFGSFGTAISVLIGRIFNLGDIGKTLGVLEIGIFTGGAVGPFLGGLLFDANGSYSLAFVIMGAAVLLRIFIVTLIKPSKTDGP